MYKYPKIYDTEYEIYFQKDFKLSVDSLSERDYKLFLKCFKQDYIKVNYLVVSRGREFVESISMIAHNYVYSLKETHITIGVIEIDENLCERSYQDLKKKILNDARGFAQNFVLNAGFIAAQDMLFTSGESNVNFRYRFQDKKFLN